MARAAGGGAVDAAAVAHLEALLGANTRFPPASGVAAAIAGFTNEDDVLRAIGHDPDVAPPPPVAGVAPDPDANVDLDGDGTNDFYVQPMTRVAAVLARSGLNARERPDLHSPRVDVLGRGERVDVIGSSGDWYAVDLANRVRFMHKHWLILQRA